MKLFIVEELNELTLVSETTLCFLTFFVLKTSCKPDLGFYPNDLLIMYFFHKVSLKNKKIFCEILVVAGQIHA